MEFPQFKEELLEILPLITPLKTLNQIKPNEKFSKNAGERLLARLPDLPVTFWSNFRLIFKNKIFKPTRRLTMPQTLVSIIVALSILFGGSYAIEASGPGDVFYQADRVIEVFRERLTLSLEKEISLRFRFATERLEEAQKKISEGNIEDSMSGLAAYNKAIIEIIKIVGENQNSLNQEEIREMSQESLSKQAGILDRIRLSWPEHDTKHQHAYQKSYQIANMGAEALLGPNEDAPFGPPEEAPLGPNEDAPQAPNEDAPQAPNEDEHQAPNEDAPQEPNEDAPQEPNDDAPQGPTSGKP